MSANVFGGKYFINTFVNTSSFNIRNIYITFFYPMSLVTFRYNSQTQFQQSNNIIWLRI